MLSYVLGQLISDAMVIIPVGIIVTGLIVYTIDKLNIQPLKKWLYEED